MKFLVDQKDLAQSLARLQPFVPKKPSHPVLANILVEAANDQLHLSGFDLAQSLRLSIAATVIEPGCITLPGSLTAAIISKCPAGPLTIAVDDTLTAAINTASGEYQVRGITADEYPTLPEVRDEAIALEAVDLYRTIYEVAYATATDDSKLILQGVNLKLDGGTLYAAATDGHRLAFTQHTLNTTAELPALTLRPAAMLAFLKGVTGPVQVAADAGEVAIATDTARLTIRPLDGQYPNYPQLVPAKFGVTALVERQLLLQALERLAIMAAETSNVVRLRFAEHQLSMTVDAAERGRAHEHLGLEDLKGELEAAFNVRYLADGLRSLTGQFVQFHMNGANLPVVLSGDGDARYLLMPVQIRG